MRKVLKNVGINVATIYDDLKILHESSQEDHKNKFCANYEDYLNQFNTIINNLHGEGILINELPISYVSDGHKGAYGLIGTRQEQAKLREIAVRSKTLLSKISKLLDSDRDKMKASKNETMAVDKLEEINISVKHIAEKSTEDIQDQTLNHLSTHIEDFNSIIIQLHKMEICKDIKEITSSERSGINLENVNRKAKLLFERLSLLARSDLKTNKIRKKSTILNSDPPAKIHKKLSIISILAIMSATATLVVVGYETVRIPLHDNKVESEIHKSYESEIKGYKEEINGLLDSINILLKNDTIEKSNILSHAIIDSGNIKSDEDTPLPPTWILEDETNL